MPFDDEDKIDGVTVARLPSSTAQRSATSVNSRNAPGNVNRSVNVSIAPQFSTVTKPVAHGSATRTGSTTVLKPSILVPKPPTATPVVGNSGIVGTEEDKAVKSFGGDEGDEDKGRIEEGEQEEDEVDAEGYEEEVVLEESEQGGEEPTVLVKSREKERKEKSSGMSDREKEIREKLSRTNKEIKDLVYKNVGEYKVLFKQSICDWTNLSTLPGKSKEISTLDEMSKFIDHILLEGDPETTLNKIKKDSSEIDAMFRKCFGARAVIGNAGKKSVKRQIAVDANIGIQVKEELTKFIELIVDIKKTHRLTIAESKALVVNEILSEKRPQIRSMGGRNKGKLVAGEYKLYRVRRNALFVKAKKEIFEKGVKDILKDTTCLNDSLRDREELNKKAELLGPQIQTLIEFQLRHNTAIDIAKEKNPAIKGKFVDESGAEVQLFITSNGGVITALTADQRRVVGDIDDALRNCDFDKPISMDLGTGEGKSFMVNEVIPKYLNGTWDTKLTLKKADGTEELLKFVEDDSVFRKTKFVNVALTDLHSGITREEAEQKLLALFNERMCEKAPNSKKTPRIQIRDGVIEIENANEFSFENIVLAVDEYYQLPEPAFNAINKFIREFKKRGIKCQLLMVSATPNLSIADTEKEQKIGDQEKKEGFIKKHNSLREKFKGTLQDFQVMGVESENTSASPKSGKHRLGLLEDDIKGSLTKDMNSSADRVQLLLPDFEPGDLDTMVKNGLAKGMGIKTILFRNAKNELVCYKVDNRGTTIQDKAPNLEVYDPLENGRTLMLYSRADCIGGDFGKYSASVDQQLIYSREPLDTAQIRQYTARNRREDMTGLGNDKTCVTIRTNELYGSTEEFIEEASKAERLKEARTATNFFKNQIHRQMLEIADENKKETPSGVVKKKKDIVAETKEILKYIKCGGSVAHINGEYDAELMRHLGAYESSLRREERLCLMNQEEVRAKSRKSISVPVSSAE
ncbi:MAG: hypothetical protein LBI29_02020, partial [Rickettsiales bacterium]|nr:hypothetical protein [Rickettsiales bacterium]